MNKVGVKVFVNALTIFRCIFTFSMPFLMDRISKEAFLMIIIALYFTDWMDGFISRKFKVQTLFGSLMDTIADKVLCIVLIFCIRDVHWILYYCMLGEVMIGVVNVLGAFSGASVASIYLGKVKMWALAIITMMGYLLYFQLIDEILVNVTGIVVLLMQVAVIIAYSKKAVQKRTKRDKFKLKQGKELSYALFNTDYYLKTLEEPLLDKLRVIKD